MNLQPLGDRVVVKPMSEEDMKTPSGIIIPDSAQEKPQEGEVVAVGPGEPNDKGEKINGQSSKSVAVIEQTNKFDSVFNITSNAQVISGWQRETGFLNDELQRLQDNQYYNTFAYSLGSVIDYDLSLIHI